MSKFNVGDRVRVIEANAVPEILGTVTTITNIGGPCIWHPNCHEIDIRDQDGCVLCGTADSLEPYYDGHERVSWSECAWQPNKVRM